MDYVSLRVWNEHRREYRRPGEDIPARSLARRYDVGVWLERLLDVDIPKRRTGESGDYRS